MRLTPDLINSSLSYLNPLKERELDLRGHKIPTIENLAVAGPQDAIDLTDNSLTSLSNFPLSPRLSTLLLARNRISHISPTLHASLPNLQVLVLTANNIGSLADLASLSGCKKLLHLVLLDNPVVRKENYRPYIIHILPTLRFLDFSKIKDSDRAHATSLFGTLAAPTPLSQQIAASGRKVLPGSGSGTFEVPADVDALNGSNGNGGRGGKEVRVKLTKEERKRVEEMIRGAKSLREIERLEKELSEGRVPSGMAHSAADVEMG